MQQYQHGSHAATVMATFCFAVLCSGQDLSEAVHLQLCHTVPGIDDLLVCEKIGQFVTR
jgi:hypothetical protein